jgi:hypothetical protein
MRNPSLRRGHGRRFCGDGPHNCGYERGATRVDILQLSADGRAHHSNVVLLCANCHTKVDKASDNYPAELLKQWKERHDETLQLVFGTPEFPSREDGLAFIGPFLEENRSIFDQYGPTPGDFSEARASQWRRHAIATIVPNNAAIARALKRNRSLLGAKERRTADVFAIHAREFSERHLLKNLTAGSTQFPENMDMIFKGDPA